MKTRTEPSAKIKVELLKADVPTSVSGNIYPSEVCEKMVEQINENEVVIFDGYKMELPRSVEDIAGHCKKAWMEDGQVFIEVDGRIVTGRMAINGIGKVNDEGVITEFELQSIDMVKPE